MSRGGAEIWTGRRRREREEGMNVIKNLSGDGGATRKEKMSFWRDRAQDNVSSGRKKEQKTGCGANVSPYSRAQV